MTLFFAQIAKLAVYNYDRVICQKTNLKKNILLKVYPLAKVDPAVCFGLGVR